MPTRYLDDETPVVQFDPLLEISPFVLFRRLKEGKEEEKKGKKEEGGKEESRKGMRKEGRS